MGLQDF